MGRYSQGAVTTAQALKIELSYLLKEKYIQRGKQISGVLDWYSPSGVIIASIKIYSNYVDEHQIILRLIYLTTDCLTGVSKEYIETILLEAVPSNLGKGHCLYFLCPQTDQRCRILYRCYNSPIWKSVAAYSHRIYYPTQKASKMQYANKRYWQLDRQIKKIEHNRRPGTYKGKPTKRAIRLERLKSEQQEANYLRFLPEAYPMSLRKALFD